MQMKAEETKASLLREAGLNETEILDKLSQSQTRANEYIANLYEKFNQQTIDSLKSQVKKNKREEEDESDTKY